VRTEELTHVHAVERSRVIRERVERARARRIERQGKPNARLLAPEVDTHCMLDNAAAVLLAKAIARLGLSGRGYHRVLNVARTIADVAASEAVGASHVAEAIQYRGLERVLR
jgi:magnesium chelatase family protein